MMAHRQSRAPKWAVVLALLQFAGCAAQYESYPADWCDRKFGTPTSTTGECMCKSRCEGRGCQKAQGFIWYKHTDCPSCACVAADPNAPVDQGDDEPEDETAAEPTGDWNPNAEASDDRTTGERVFDFIDEHGHSLIAVVLILVLIAVFVPIVVLNAYHKVNDAEKAKSAAAKPAAVSKAPAAAAAADEDEDEDEKPRKRTPKAD